MRKRWLQYAPLAAVLVLIVLWLDATSAGAQSVQRAGVVVVTEDGVIESDCVPFVESTLTGIELLDRSRFAADVAYSNAGALVCAVDGRGCPTDDCFCACPAGGEACTFWSYWRLDVDGWGFAPTGAHQTVIRDGSVDGWVWGPGGTNGGTPPPATTFDDVCPVGVATTVDGGEAAPALLGRPAVYITLAALSLVAIALWRRGGVGSDHE